MAAIDDKKKLTTPATAAQQATPVAASEAAASPYTGLAGLSEGTKQQLGQLGAGYTPSQNVTAAQQYLQNVVSGKPGNYQSQFQGQLESLYQQVMNRDPFNFDLNGNILYNQYKDQYTQQGKQAMKDTMGQAAALTGGYGNSYAQTAGQQAYQNYLTQLNNIVPELYQQEYERYNQEGANLQNKLSLTQGLEDSAYGKYRDTVTDWNNERAHATDEYWNQYNADYSNYANMLNYWNTLGQQENSQYNADRELAYNQAMAILQAGKMPSDDLLAAAGISAADAKSLKKSGGGGSSSGSKSGSGSKSTGNASTPAQTTLGAVATVTYNSLKNGLARGVDQNKILNGVEAQVKKGKITAAEGQEIVRKLGI